MRTKRNKLRGCPPKPEPERIPDTFDNILKGLVTPVKKVTGTLKA